MAERAEDSTADTEQQFREFVAARSPALLRTAYLLAGDRATAEDLLQSALIKTYLAWRRLGGIEAVEPYARRVLVNTSTSWWRRRWHGERPSEVLPERAAPDELDALVERDALWPHVQALPRRQRAVLVLRFYLDMSEAQTAEELEISVGTVKSQTSRALSTLRQRLKTEADGDDELRALIARRVDSAAGAKPAMPGAPAIRVPAPRPPQSPTCIPGRQEDTVPIPLAASAPAGRTTIPAARGVHSS